MLKPPTGLPVNSKVSEGSSSRHLRAYLARQSSMRSPMPARGVGAVSRASTYARCR